MTTESKITIYKAILEPIWTYSIQLWGTASNSNIDILERYQTKTLRIILSIPCCISNRFIYHDLHIPTMIEEIQKHSKSYQELLAVHPNALTSDLIKRGQRYSRIGRPNVLDLHRRFT